MARIKYFNQTTRTWEYADSASDVQSSGQNAKVAYVWVQPEMETFTGQVLRQNGNDPAIPYVHDVGVYAKINVASFEKIVVSGYQWDASQGFYLVAFADENGIATAVHTESSSGAYSEREIEVPEGSMWAYINGHAREAPVACNAYKRYDIDVLVEEKANRIAKWVSEPITIVSGNLKFDSGSTHNITNGRYGIVNNVSRYKKIQARGYQWPSKDFGLCQFWDSNGALISAHRAVDEDTKATLVLDVPNNAKTLTVNGHIYNELSVSGYKVYDVQDIYDDLKNVGKKVITLGDSITALGTNDTGWVKYFLEKTECRLIANVAVNGACLHDKEGTVYDGNPVFNGADENVNNVLGNQVQKIINNAYESPDIIMIAIGTNGGISITKEQIGAAYYDSSNALIPLANVDRTTSAGAYRWCLDKLHETYPNAIIFWCTPIIGHQTIRHAENAMNYAESLRIATEYTGQNMIDTIRCGINGINEVNGANGEYLADGLHPNVNGAKKIGYYNASKVMPFLSNSFTLT